MQTEAREKRIGKPDNIGCSYCGKEQGSKTCSGCKAKWLCLGCWQNCKCLNKQCKYFLEDLLGKQESGRTKLSQSRDKDRGGRTGGHSRGRDKHGGGAKPGDSGQSSGGGDEIDNDGGQSGDKGTQSCGDENFGGQSSNNSAGQSKGTNVDQSDSDNVGHSGGSDQFSIDGGQSSNNISEESGEKGHQSDGYNGGQSGGGGKSSGNSAEQSGGTNGHHSVDKCGQPGGGDGKSEGGQSRGSDKFGDKSGQSEGDGQSSDKSQSALGSDGCSDKVGQSVDNNKNSKDSQVGVQITSDLDQISDKTGDAQDEIQSTRFSRQLNIKEFSNRSYTNTDIDEIISQYSYPLVYVINYQGLDPRESKQFDSNADSDYHIRNYTFPLALMYERCDKNDQCILLWKISDNILIIEEISSALLNQLTLLNPPQIWIQGTWLPNSNIKTNNDSTSVNNKSKKNKGPEFYIYTGSSNSRLLCDMKDCGKPVLQDSEGRFANWCAEHASPFFDSDNCHSEFENEETQNTYIQEDEEEERRITQFLIDYETGSFYKGPPEDNYAKTRLNQVEITIDNKIAASCKDKQLYCNVCSSQNSLYKFFKCVNCSRIAFQDCANMIEGMCCYCKYASEVVEQVKFWIRHANEKNCKLIINEIPNFILKYIHPRYFEGKINHLFDKDMSRKTYRQEQEFEVNSEDERSSNTYIDYNNNNNNNNYNNSSLNNRDNINNNIINDDNTLSSNSNNNINNNINNNDSNNNNNNNNFNNKNNNNNNNNNSLNNSDNNSCNNNNNINNDNTLSNNDNINNDNINNNDNNNNNLKYNNNNFNNNNNNNNNSNKNDESYYNNCDEEDENNNNNDDNSEDGNNKFNYELTKIPKEQLLYEAEISKTIEVLYTDPGKFEFKTLSFGSGEGRRTRDIDCFHYSDSSQKLPSKHRREYIGVNDDDETLLARWERKSVICLRLAHYKDPKTNKLTGYHRRFFPDMCIYESPTTSLKWVCLGLLVVRCTSRRIDALMFNLKNGKEPVIWTNAIETLKTHYCKVDEQFDYNKFSKIRFGFWDRSFHIYDLNKRVIRIDTTTPGDNSKTDEEEIVQRAFSLWEIVRGVRKVNSASISSRKPQRQHTNRLENQKVAQQLSDLKSQLASMTSSKESLQKKSEKQLQDYRDLQAKFKAASESMKSVANTNVKNKRNNNLPKRSVISIDDENDSSSVDSRSSYDVNAAKPNGRKASCLQDYDTILQKQEFDIKKTRLNTLQMQAQEYQESEARLINMRKRNQIDEEFVLAEKIRSEKVAMQREETRHNWLEEGKQADFNRERQLTRDKIAVYQMITDCNTKQKLFTTGVESTQLKTEQSILKKVKTTHQSSSKEETEAFLDSLDHQDIMTYLQSRINKLEANNEE